MRQWTGLALIALLVAGCARPIPEPPSFRDRSRPIASAALFDADAFAGQWHAVAAFAPDCAAWQFDFGPGRLIETCDGNASTASLAPSGPGRFTVDGGAGETDLWVIWVAHDYDTAVIGSPDGAIGVVLSRSAAISADRMASAREMLDFNGFDISRLTRLAP